MYKIDDKLQTTLLDFNQPLGLKMNPDNRWIKMANIIPWDEFEKKYKNLFKSKTGNVAKPLRMALGALIIQTRFQYSDRELVEQITENPYLQYFIGLPGYQEEAPFDASTLVLFRKRINAQMIIEANEYLLTSEQKNDDEDDDNHDDNDDNENHDNENHDNNDEAPSGNNNSDSHKTNASTIPNSGTLTLDATCAPVNVRFPQDISLLNEAREKFERIIKWFHNKYGLELPRRDCKAARKNYLNYAKAKKHTSKFIRKTLKKQLAYLRRNIGHVEAFMEQGYAPEVKDINVILTIFKLYEQQKYMFENHTHTVENRIVSLSQSWIRPIVRGKVKAPTEFGAKLDLSLDADGYARIEKISFDAYNESTCLKDAVEAYFTRTGHYPERVLADQIYRTRANRSYCLEHGIRLSGPKLGRPSIETVKTDKEIEYQDNTDRIEVERRFSLTKRCYGLGKIMTKLSETQLTSIALSILVANIDKKLQQVFFALFYLFLKKWKPNGWLTVIGC